MAIVGISGSSPVSVPSITTCSRTDGLGEIINRAVANIRPRRTLDQSSAAEATQLGEAGFRFAVVGPLPHGQQVKNVLTDIPNADRSLDTLSTTLSSTFTGIKFPNVGHLNTIAFMNAAELLGNLRHAGLNPSTLFLHREVRQSSLKGIEIIAQDNGIGIRNIPAVIEAGYGRTRLPAKGKGFPKVLETICYFDQGELIVESKRLGFVYTYAVISGDEEKRDFILRRQFESGVRKGTRVSLGYLSSDGWVRETILRQLQRRARSGLEPLLRFPIHTLSAKGILKTKGHSN